MTRLMAVASFKLDIKLQGTANYEEWSLRIQTAMLTLNYNRIVLGDELEDDVPPGTRQEQRDWRYCFKERRLKAHHMLVEHITWEVMQCFQAEVRSGDPTQLWSALRTEFDNGESMDDKDLADVTLSNAVEVYPGHAREHAERKRATRAKPELRDATARLENAELIADNMPGADRRGSDQRGGSQGLGSREVYNVTELNNGDRQARGRAGRGISRPRSPSSSSTRSKKKKKKSVCFRCGSDKHFVRDCPQPATYDTTGARRDGDVETLNVMLTPRNAGEVGCAGSTAQATVASGSDTGGGDELDGGVRTSGAGSGPRPTAVSGNAAAVNTETDAPLGAGRDVNVSTEVQMYTSS
ncbi:hypothetical protein F442_15823 [Phytophthora nicotianae P10297]|uniref:CCHC-type domain-containing protein n=1 Tax=Phytophthora nicotianae P10297 TaxID=1317064 RepID=W2YNC9_PHYNI|nr:hypothetical protein F442_15823 [Phytophthora nicotianae P10297]